MVQAVLAVAELVHLKMGLQPQAQLILAVVAVLVQQHLMMVLLAVLE